jgi:hypothetical protein
MQAKIAALSHILVAQLRFALINNLHQLQIPVADG